MAVNGRRGGMRTCVVGMGMMGSALADALLARNKPVSVWNRSREKCQTAVDTGAEMAGSVAEGAANCDVLISCLADYHAVSDVVITDDVAGNLNGKTLVQLSQASPDQSRGIAKWAEANGIGYLDGSILGYPKSIRDNDCMIVYSGSQQVFESCHEVLHALGANARLLGKEPGMATSFDKAYFSAYYAHMVGLIHGAAICDAVGAPLDIYFELMVESWDWSIQDVKCAAMIRNRDYSDIEATLATHGYAYAQVAPLCEKIGVSAALPKAIQEAFETAYGMGLGSGELAELFEAFRADRD